MDNWTWGMIKEDTENEQDSKLDKQPVACPTNSCPDLVLQLLDKVGKNREWNGILIGRHAMQLLSGIYEEEIRKIRKKRPKLAPGDGDRLVEYFGGTIEADILQRTLRWREVREAVTGIQTKAQRMTAFISGKSLQIDVSSVIGGVCSTEVEETALTIALIDGQGGIPVKVLHPMHCLSAATHALQHPEGSRSDFGNLWSAMLLLRGYLQSNLHKPGKVLVLIKRIFATALTEAGLYANDHRVDLVRAIPVREIQRSPEDKYRKFLEFEYPREIERLNQKRDRHLRASASQFLETDTYIHKVYFMQRLIARNQSQVREVISLEEAKARPDTVKIEQLHKEIERIEKMRDRYHRDLIDDLMRELRAYQPPGLG